MTSLVTLTKKQPRPITLSEIGVLSQRLSKNLDDSQKPWERALHLSASYLKSGRSGVGEATSGEGSEGGPPGSRLLLRLLGSGTFLLFAGGIGTGCGCGGSRLTGRQD